MSKAAITVSAAPDVWQAADWQRLWLSLWTQKRSWRSLALVPAGPGATPQTFLQIAVALARTGTIHTKIPIHVADATQVQLGQLEPFSAELTSHIGDEEMMVIALSPLDENVTALPLAKQADCALLCVVLGEMSGADARKTVSQIGASHFIGSAVFRLPSR
jgi:hypothetical protein